LAGPASARSPARVFGDPITAGALTASRACRSCSTLGPTSGRRRGSKPRWRCRVDCPLCRKSSRKAGAPR